MPIGIYIRTEETRKALSEARKLNPVRYWLGKGHLRTGENAPNYKGGFTPYETLKRWRIKNKEKVNFINRLRQRQVKGTLGSHTLEEWNALKLFFNFTCQGCFKSEPEIKLTEDHIIPISKGGSDNIENIQPLCGSCNSRKGSGSLL